MKKKLLLVCCVLIVFTANSQISAPNGGFENWTNATYDSPQNFNQTSNTEAFYRAGAAFNCLKVADPFHASYAIQLNTVIGTIDTVMGYFINGDASGPPSSWQGGIPYNQQATGISGQYKSAIPAGDTAHIVVDFKLADTTIGFYVFNLYGTHSTYTPFHFEFIPALTLTPDSIIFGAASSDFINNVSLPGSMLQLDSINFTGVASQPALFNGDFESWNTNPIYSLDNWYQAGGGSNPATSVLQTTDAVAGVFALELVTTLGDNNGTPRANPGSEGTGYYNCNGSGPCNLLGGNPFTNMVDTLCFYYKYVPTNPMDTAQVSMIFKLNGTQQWWAGDYMTASPTYQYREVPVNLSGPIDSVIIMFQSSLWQDSLFSYIGADLKVDEVHFKSQPLTTGVGFNSRNANSAYCFPNPFTNSSTLFINLNVVLKNAELNIYDAVGRRVMNKELSAHKTIIDKNNLSEGIYFYEILNNNQKINSGKIVVQ